jgi:uncharacterized protein
MRKTTDGSAYSATDIVNFIECAHITTLDLVNLQTPLEPGEDDEQAKLIQERGIEHERTYLAKLEAQGYTTVRLAGPAAPLDEVAAQTLDAMRSGVAVIYQAALKDGVLAGYADFLVRVERPSSLGSWSYEVEDTKLARSPKSKFLVQLCFYSAILSKLQGVVPERMYVVLGDGTKIPYLVADYIRYYETQKDRFLERVSNTTTQTYPERCAKCGECRWSHLCEKQWDDDDHLNRVANIRSSQIHKLNDAGIYTLADLAALHQRKAIPSLAQESLEKIRHQAQLQFRARQMGQRFVEMLPLEPEAGKGFARLPKRDPDDLYFDMEGDPLEYGGLEYLFGIGSMTAGKLQFKAFWAHTREEERQAFEAFMDFVGAHLRQHPGAHIYHYAHYEETALKRLMSLHGTRENEVDNLLRGQKLVDLYKVVREGIRVSEPGYSIKNIEHFYMPRREGEVQNAGASIVYYERWRQTRDDALLKKIEDYNLDDVRSTQMLHDWLCGLRPASLAWRAAGASGEATNASAIEAAELELADYKEKLLGGIPDNAGTLTQEQQMRVLTYQLLNFHRREQKPQWWALFNRMDLDEADLIDDIECLGGLVADGRHPPRPDKKSIIYSYRYPEQETKLKDGDSVTRADTGEGLNEIELDPEQRLVRLRIGAKREAPPPRLSLGPGRPIEDKKLRARIRTFADSIVANDGRFEAIKGIFLKQRPVIDGHGDGQPLVEDPPQIGQVIEVIAGLQNSHLFIQGPPGAGKTFTGSHVIADLLKQGKTIGVSSNSHKAIHNLLEGIVKLAAAQRIEFRGFKKSSQNNEDSRFDCPQYFDNSDKIGHYNQDRHLLLAGTAWAFADLNDDQQLDYLFVDEAGQVSLANLVAMSLNAKNIVLLGDQMQLDQPTQGVHPGRSGESVLEYLLDGRATIPAEEGIFLPLTWRMHPAVCGFISQAVYDGRLHSAPGLEKQTLVLNQSAHPALTSVGVRYLPVDHVDCSQKSEEEAVAIRDIFSSLLEQEYIDKTGSTLRLTSNDILVVSPYNMQVNLLRRTLPDGARIGTVDKFQGQEAQVVLVSMSTSSGDDLPRGIEFLYSKNRLNVAISRAKCLALVVANPKLMSVHTSTPAQMALINTLCWVKDWSRGDQGVRR